VSTPKKPPTDLREQLPVQAKPPTDLREQLPVQAKLAATWTSFMFLYVYVDILGLYMPGVIDDILAGIVWEFDISQAWATGALTLVAIPILMVMLSMTLPARANRTTNLVVASAYTLISVGNAMGEPWTYFFALAVGLEVILLAAILRLAWTWPRTTSPAPTAHDTTHRPKTRTSAHS
jgi:hypothetical protein